MKLALALLVALPLQTSGAWGQSDAETRQALNNTHHQMVICVAYNTIVAACVRDRDDMPGSAETADAYDQHAENLLLLAYYISQKIGMTPDAHKSRMTHAWSEMDKLIQHSCTNISSLYSRHADRCKRVAENPDSILTEYLNQETR